MTIAYEEAAERETPIGSPVSVITYSFTSSAGGAASEQTKKISGVVERIVTNPDNSVPPDANWDVTITDEDGVDVLAGAGANRDAGGTGVSEQVKPDVVVASKLTFNVTNAGAAKKAVVKVYVR